MTPGLGHCHPLMVANAGVQTLDCLHFTASQPIRSQGLTSTANQKPGIVYTDTVRCDHQDHNHHSHHRSHRPSVMTEEISQSQDEADPSQPIALLTVLNIICENGEIWRLG